MIRDEDIEKASRYEIALEAMKVLAPVASERMDNEGVNVRLLAKGCVAIADAMLEALDE